MVGGGGGQGGCEWRSEVFVKIQKKKKLGRGGCLIRGVGGEVARFWVGRKDVNQE